MPWLIFANWRILAAAILAVVMVFTHWRAYDAGKSSVLNKYQAYIADIERATRAREHQLTQAKQQAEERYETEKRNAATANAGARAELERLRRTLAQRQTPRAAQAPAPIARIDAASPPERQLLGECAQTAVEVAGDADRLAAQLTGLQDYVRHVCITPQ